MSLRATGYVLFGIVRIYSKKTDYTLHDLERAKKLFYHFAEKERQRAVHPRGPRHAVAPNISTIAEENEDQGKHEFAKI